MYCEKIANEKQSFIRQLCNRLQLLLRVSNVEDMIHYFENQTGEPAMVLNDDELKSFFSEPLHTE